MATTTPRIGLTKPDGTDLVDIAVLNTNFDKIDSNIASTKIQSTKPTTANAGDLWWDSDTGTLYLYYTDANSSQWVAATSDPINIGVVANQTERDAQYPTPAQGMSVYRTDLGVTQRYYGLYNSSTNPGGKPSAGWYFEEGNIFVDANAATRGVRVTSPTEGMVSYLADTNVVQAYDGSAWNSLAYQSAIPTVGLVPVIPTGVTQSGGSASHDSTTGLVTYTGVTVFQVNGIFTSGFKNYRIVMDQTQTASNPPLWRAVVGGTVQTANNYYSQEANFNGTGSGIGRQVAESAGRLGYIDANQRGTFQMDVFTPYLSSTDTRFQNYENRGNSSAIIIHFHASQYFVNNQVEGVQISVSSGNMTGTFKVYGYN